MPLLHPYVRHHKMTYFTIYNNSTNKLHTNILKMVIYTMTSSMAGQNMWEVIVYRTIFNILVCILLVQLSSNFVCTIIIYNQSMHGLWVT